MKKVLITASMVLIACIAISCNNSQDSNTHKHEDGSTHTDHDTTKPKQQEFKADSARKESTVEHTHDDSTKHSH